MLITYCCHLYIAITAVDVATVMIVVIVVVIQFTQLIVSNARSNDIDYTSTICH